jgi:hypothetical protein
MTATPYRPALPARRRAVTPAAAGALLLAGLAAGCGPHDDQFPPACPGLSLVPGAGEITRFAGTGRDPGDMVLHAQITAVPAKCERDGAASVKSTLHIEADLTRGVAASAATPPVTYFVAVSESGKVLREHDFPLAAQFPPNSDRMTVKGDDLELLVPVSATKSAAAYHIYVGFRLSHDDLTYNRTHHTQ